MTKPKTNPKRPKPKNSGRPKGTPNKSTALVTERLATLEYEDRDGKKRVGYDPIKTCVELIEWSMSMAANATPSLCSSFLKVASMNNNKLMDKLYGNIEIQKRDSSITAAEIAATLPQIQMIENYKPVIEMINDTSDDTYDEDNDDE